MTPAPNGTFLDGITRQRTIGLLRDAGETVVETSLRYADFQNADEIFSSGNFAKLSAITRIDERELQAGPAVPQGQRTLPRLRGELPDLGDAFQRRSFGEQFRPNLEPHAPRPVCRPAHRCDRARQPGRGGHLQVPEELFAERRDRGLGAARVLGVRPEAGHLSARSHPAPLPCNGQTTRGPA